MSANDVQIGGSHYKLETSVDVDHWDMVEANGMGYMEGNATKYLFRWKNKNGVQDLKKAQHYVVKLIEISKWYNSLSFFEKLTNFFMNDHPRGNRARPIMNCNNPLEIHTWCADHNVGDKESQVCSQLMHWVHYDDLVLAELKIRELIQKEEVKGEDRAIVAQMNMGHSAIAADELRVNQIAEAEIIAENTDLSLTRNYGE